MNGERPRVALIGIDAAESTLVQSMIARGKLPTLAALHRLGSSGVLTSPADLYSGAVWPTFYSGLRPAWHGIYHNKLWQPDRMCCIVPDPRTFSARPFWEAFGTHGIPSCVVDVPLVLGGPRDIVGTYLGGWSTHDGEPIRSWPAPLARQIRREFGAPAMPREAFGSQSVESLERLCGELHRATEQLARIGVGLLRRDDWRFFCLAFGAAHRAGHYLWDAGEAPNLHEAGIERLQRLELAVEEVYSTIDHALGALLAHCEGALVVVFALHGMGPNTGWSEVVPAMLDARRTALSQQPPRKGALYRARQALVTRLRPVLQHLSPSLTARMVPLWSSRMFDWPSTRYFPLPMDLTGLLRINLRGRERTGIVAPGAEYAALCAELESFFKSLRDAGTGAPVVAEIVRAYADSPAEATHRNGQPDLIVKWRESRTRDVSRLSSSELPAFDCEVPRYLPSGRSGNHRPLGWFVATGSGIPAGRQLGIHDIVDLAPTVRQCLGLDPEPRFHGRPLPLAAGRSRSP
jgi:predicted AlkP superfamily phosphohydrolase/phosphomutase